MCKKDAEERAKWRRPSRKTDPIRYGRPGKLLNVGVRYTGAEEGRKRIQENLMHLIQCVIVSHLRRINISTVRVFRK